MARRRNASATRIHVRLIRQEDPVKGALRVQEDDFERERGGAGGREGRGTARPRSAGVMIITMVPPDGDALADRGRARLAWRDALARAVLAAVRKRPAEGQ